ncbi:ABC transporter permease [Terrabacter sp. MAHUQ-38]|uniref:ABC transporter permease n=1 Tax=unclassified Terrabacter TaxID=2630222 RepID=UPI00165E371D|nr:ABC transporter permease [Terrabacter sp. MAHUQ-38]MBC9822717.1 ABC transporter permease [Terrabacter sp. MAHUQ-38]
MIGVSQFNGLLAKRQVLRTLVERDLRVRYAGSVLGYVWTVLDPLLMALVYFIVFTLIFQARQTGNQPYFLHLVTGLFLWQWFASNMSETSRALLSESRLVRSANLPRELWVVRVVLAKGIEFILTLPVIIAFTAYYLITGETKLHWTLVMIPVALVLTFLLSVGIGMILAPITVLVTDMARVVRIALRLGFYATPVLYSADMAPGTLQTVLALNPMSGILELFRSGFFRGEMNLLSVASACVLTVILLLIGAFVFKRLEPAVLKEI